MFEKKYNMLENSKYKNVYEALAYEHQVKCPYCGGVIVHDVTKEDDISFKIKCPSCGAQIDVAKPMEYAVGLKKIEPVKVEEAKPEKAKHKKFSFAKKKEKKAK